MRIGEVQHHVVIKSMGNKCELHPIQEPDSVRSTDQYEYLEHSNCADHKIAICV